MRATHFSSPILLEHVVDARLKRVWTEEKSVSAYGIRIRLPEGVLIFANDFDVGAHEHLEARTEAVPRAVLRCRRAIHEVRMGIHGIVVKGANQPWVEPVVGASEPTGELNGGGGGDGRRCSGSNHMVVVMTKHSKPV